TPVCGSRLRCPRLWRPRARFCASVQPAATITGISAMPSCRAASILAWPAISPPSSPTSAGVVQPHSLMLAAIGDHHRDLGDAELPGGEYPSVARDQPTILAHQRRRRPAPLLDARSDRGDLGIRVVNVSCWIYPAVVCISPFPETSLSGDQRPAACVFRSNVITDSGEDDHPI